MRTTTARTLFLPHYHHRVAGTTPTFPHPFIHSPGITTLPAVFHTGVHTYPAPHVPAFRQSCPPSTLFLPPGRHSQLHGLQPAFLRPPSQAVTDWQAGGLKATCANPPLSGRGGKGGRFFDRRAPPVRRRWAGPNPVPHPLHPSQTLPVEPAFYPTLPSAIFLYNCTYKGRRGGTTCFSLSPGQAPNPLPPHPRSVRYLCLCPHPTAFLFCTPARYCSPHCPSQHLPRLILQTYVLPSQWTSRRGPVSQCLPPTSPSPFIAQEEDGLSSLWTPPPMPQDRMPPPVPSCADHSLRAPTTRPPPSLLCPPPPFTTISWQTSTPTLNSGVRRGGAYLGPVPSQHHSYLPLTLSATSPYFAAARSPLLDRHGREDTHCPTYLPAYLPFTYSTVTESYSWDGEDTQQHASYHLPSTT